MAELDPVIHAEARLRVVAALTTLGEGNQISFPRLRKLLDMTAGNLSTHLRKLEDAEYVQQTKVIEGRMPATYVEITAKGRSAFLDYRRSLQSLLDGAQPTPNLPTRT
ncbi:helix-turn-helix domain-containing protein [Pseudarthrobacter psychrotolerans]|uniref:Helix-turn-helix domain-containing protein n=1 Tax=Pseudarthrobacter psychrotolerans TaxID=2697569 RepID=A0A6P1NIJ7_9MICC|nr:transcriptional regulator [Pseudarthrobacter psychrotolerans]QHK18943.1 helix-turn-helix domain-containing protein [Pseudarthrobacter psychrotolerans]